MASKASGTLFLIIEKQHASWSLMVTASPALDLRFCHRLRIASARPLVGPKCPWTRVVGCMCLEVTNGLPAACISQFSLYINPLPFPGLMGASMVEPSVARARV